MTTTLNYHDHHHVGTLPPQLENFLASGLCTDASWGNDAAAKVFFPCVGNFGAYVWIDSEDPQESEFCEERMADARKRFIVCFALPPDST